MPDAGTVVVTGANGFLGRACVPRLAAAGYRVRGLVRALDASTAASAQFMPVGDLTQLDDAGLHNALRGATTVVHLAALAHRPLDATPQSAAALRRLNVDVSERLARAAAASGVTHFVFASSVKVNGETSPPGRPLVESDPPNPEDDYAASKWAAECALAAVAEQSGLRVTALRLPLTYGPGAKANFAALVRAVRRGVPLPLAGITNRRSLLGTGNFCAALACAYRERRRERAWAVDALFRGRCGTRRNTRPRARDRTRAARLSTAVRAAAVRSAPRRGVARSQRASRAAPRYARSRHGRIPRAIRLVAAALARGRARRGGRRQHAAIIGPMTSRSGDRRADQLRPLRFTRGFTKHAEGSVLVEIGDTRVLCTASVEEGVPAFMKGRGEGWLTAEYGMLPRATHTRGRREAAEGRPSGRTQEIQRLIGRSLRAVTDLAALGERTLKIDCDVLQADGGTRCASITGACVAVADALAWCRERGLVAGDPLRELVAAVSVGIVGGVPMLDLDYAEDSGCDTDMNVVMTAGGGFVEVQGTAEGAPFTQAQLSALLGLAASGIGALVAGQRAALSR